MSTRPSTFRKRDVARLVAAAESAGKVVTGIRVHRSGAIEVVTGKFEAQESDDQGANEWDSLKAQ